MNFKGIMTKEIKIYLLVFFLGSQTMILELTLPRLLAPAFGNTLYCWTAAISVVLIGLSIGYFLGGLLSSRSSKPNTRLLWRLAAVASFFVLAAGFIGDKLVQMLSHLGLIWGPLVSTCLLTLPSLIAGAAVLPLSVAAVSTTLQSGNSSGRIYSISTMGSVTGVLLTGYFLLPYFGINLTLYLATVPVFALAAISRLHLSITIAIGLAFLLTSHDQTPTNKNTLMDRSNGFHRIKIVKDANDESIRMLFLDSTLEGAVKLGSNNPGVPYQREGALITDHFPNLKQCFFIGGGSFSIPRYIKSKRSFVRVDVAEIDSDVILASKKYLELPSNLNIFMGDGRRVLNGTSMKYDLIMNDAFHGLRNIPFHLLTREFNAVVAEKLTENGVYCINAGGNYYTSNLINSILKTLEGNFKFINSLRPIGSTSRNYWILAGNTKISVGHPIKPVPHKGMIFTDNHAPVEYLIAMDLIRDNKLN